MYSSKIITKKMTGVTTLLYICIAIRMVKTYLIRLHRYPTNQGYYHHFGLLTIYPAFSTFKLNSPFTYPSSFINFATSVYSFLAMPFRVLIHLPSVS